MPELKDITGLKDIYSDLQPIMISKELDETIKKQGISELELFVLIGNNLEYIDLPGGAKMKTLLLAVEDDKIISKKNASLEEKTKMAQEQYDVLQERMNDIEFLKKQNENCESALQYIISNLPKGAGENTSVETKENKAIVLSTKNKYVSTYILALINILVGYISVGAAKPLGNVGIITVLIMSGVSLWTTLGLCDSLGDVLFNWSDKKN